MRGLESMKIINGILGVILIVVGWFFLSLTVDNESGKTIMYKVIGLIIIAGGIYLFKTVAKLGKQ